MKNQIKYVVISLLLCIIGIGLFDKTNPIIAFETSSEMRLSLEQSTDNYELLGQMGTIQSYTNYLNPEIDSNVITNDLTRIDLTRIQKYTANSTSVNYTQGITNNTRIYQHLYGYTCSAPFDTSLRLVADYNKSSNEEYVNETSSYAISSGLITDGDLDSLSADDSDDLIYIKPAKNAWLDSYTIVEGSSVTGAMSNSYIHEDSLGINLAWGGSPEYRYIIDFYFNTTYTDNCEYTLAMELLEYTTSGERNDVYIDVYDQTGAISKSFDIPWWQDMELPVVAEYYSINSAFNSNGISKIRFRARLVLLGIDYTLIKAKVSNTANIRFDYFPDFPILDDSIPINMSYFPSISTGTISQIAINSTVLSFTPDTYNLVTYNTTGYAHSYNLILSTSVAYDNIITLKFAYSLYYPFFNPIDSIIAKNFTYTINSLFYNNNITLGLSSITGNQTRGRICLDFDSTQMTNYDYVSDLVIITQNISYQIYTPIHINFTFITNNTFNEWTVPSAINLEVNAVPVEDETYNSGFVSLIDYPESLSFTSDFESVYFNFSIDATFSYTTDLEVISHSYFSKSLLLSNFHDIVLSQVSYLFDSEIKHSYLNNIDYLNAKSIYPNYNWSSGSSIKLEVILDDNAYLPLTEVNLYGNSTVNMNLIMLSNTLEYTNSGSQTISVNIPNSFTIQDFQPSYSNIKYTEPYTHVENNSYNISEETQEIQPTITTVTNSSENFNYASILSQNATSLGTNQTILGTEVAGNYKGTHTFDNYSVGENPYWSYNSNASFSIVAAKESHNKVYYDSDSSTSVGHVRGLRTYDCATALGTTNKTIEAWFYMSTFGSNYGWWDFGLLDSTGNLINIWFYGTEEWRIGDSFGSTSLISKAASGCSSGAWFKLFLELDPVNNKFGIGKDSSTYWGFRTNILIDITSIYVNFNRVPANTWIDSISWDWSNSPSYTKGNLAFLEKTAPLYSQVNTNFTGIGLGDIKNLSLSYQFQTNISTTVNCSILNYQSNTNQTLLSNVSTSFSTVFNYNISTRAQNYFSNTLNFTLSFTSVNSTDFTFNLTNCVLNISYYNGSFMEISPNLFVTCQNQLNVGQTNNISIIVQKTVNNIHSVKFWDNISRIDQILGSTDGSYSVLISNNTSQYYSIGIYVNDTNGNFKQLNVTHIFIAKNISNFAFSGLYQTYYQNQTLNISTTLGRIVNLTIYYPNGTQFYSNWSSIQINLGFNQTGWYKLNGTYLNGSEFLNYSVETVFEILPIERTSTESGIELAVTRIEEDFTFSCISGSVFDVNLTLIMNFTLSYLSNNAIFTFIFNSTIDITTITTLNVSLSNYRSFTNIYQNGISGLNYTIVNNELYLNALNNTLFLNKDSLTFAFAYESDDYFTQLTSHLTTNDNSVYFREYAYTSKTFNNWYIESNNLVNDISILHIRNGIYPTLQNISNTYYFTESSYINDLYQLDWDLNPDFQVNYEIQFNNGTYIILKVSVSSLLTISNVTVLFTPDVYFNDWINASQNVLTNQISFELDQVDSGLTEFYLYGNRPVPNATFSRFYSGDLTITPDFSDLVLFNGYLSYDSYSEIWHVNTNSNWVLNGVHYGNITYTISNETFFCDGFDSSISQSYISFQTNPIENYSVTQNETHIIMSISVSLPISAYFIFRINLTHYSINYTRLYSLSGFDWYMSRLLSIPQGTTIILIPITYYSGISWLEYLIPFSLLLVALGLYIWLKPKYDKWQLKRKYRKELEIKDRVEKQKTLESEALKEVKIEKAREKKRRWYEF